MLPGNLIRSIFVMSNKYKLLKLEIMKTLTYVERAQYELEQLDFWFKMNKGEQGSDEWNDNMERGIDLSETVNNL